MKNSKFRVIAPIILIVLSLLALSNLSEAANADAKSTKHEECKMVEEVSAHKYQKSVDERNSDL